ncbi:MAG: hypothetical protein JWP37_933 [Mucilaginibacter sp.]|nr:hypothetical protein [Mucilaginibacter sp.]
MSTIEIDFLTTDFYRAISFKNGEAPDLTSLDILFYGNGIMVNNNFKDPITFTTESFINAFESQIAAGEVEQFMERELYSKTEIFGKVAQRVSVYEYNFADHDSHGLPRGINFIQFVLVENNWRILSMAWCDENENHVIPMEYLR